MNALVLGAVTAGLALAGQTELLAITSDREGDAEVYVMRPDGSGVTQVTRNATPDFSLDWSPDGRRLAVQAVDRAVITNANGSVRTPLAPGSYAPTWAPDGRRLAYTRIVDNFRTADLFVADADGSDERRLTDARSRQEGQRWSPDGSRIVLARGPVNGQIPHDFNVFSIDVDGGAAEQLTHVPARDAPGYTGARGPDWSPDGRRIVFETDETDRQLAVMNADGSGERPLFTGAAHYADPVWSPDGTRIAFVADAQGGRRQIAVIGADGGAVRRLSEPALGVFEPVWSPDGTRIAFTSNQDGDREVFVVDADGGVARQVTRNSASDSVSSWAVVPSPRPPGQPPSPPGGSARAVLISRKAVRLTRGVIAVRLRCPSAASVPCRGRLTLRWRKRPLGSKRFEIAPGRTAAVKVRLSRRARRTLRRVAPTRIAAVVRAAGLPTRKATFVVRRGR